jgi:hypothetical protein
MVCIGISCPLVSCTSPAAKTTPTPTKTARPAITISPSPSHTPRAADTPIPTATSLPTDTPTVMPTSTATFTPVPPPVATVPPPTPTFTIVPPSATSGPTWAFVYLENSIRTNANCGSVYLEGEITNRDGDPLDGITVRLRWWDNVEYELSGTAGGHSSGKWGFSPLSQDQNRAYQPFILDVVESQANPIPLSEELAVEMIDCSQAGQFTEITFVSTN